MDENSLSISLSQTLNLNKTSKFSGSCKKKGLSVRSTKKEPLCKLGRSLQGPESNTSYSGGDRFIPDRSTIDFDLSDYLVSFQSPKGYKLIVGFFF